MGEIKLEDLSYFSEYLVDKFNQHNIKTVDELVKEIRKKGITRLAKEVEFDRTSFTKIKKKMKEEKFFLPSQKELEKKHGYKLLSQQETSLLLGVDFNDLKILIEEGNIPKSCYLVAGEDFEPSKVNVKYLFIESLIKELSEKYNSSLEEVRNALNIEGLTISTLSKQMSYKLEPHEWQEARLTRYRWNKQWILENYYSLLKRNKTLDKKANYRDYLDEETNNYIDSYIAHRLNYDYISFDGVDYVKSKFTKKGNAESQLKLIERALYRVKCHRSGIVGFDKYDEQELTLRKLTDEEEELVLNTNFDIRTFNKEDMKAVISGMGNGSYNYRGALLPFLYFVLMKEEEKYNENLEKSLVEPAFEFNAQNEWTKLKLMKVRFENALKELPKKAPKVKRENKKVKVFARRDQVVKMFQDIITNRPGDLKEPIKYAAQILIGFMAGIRPIEINQMKINEHLDTEKDPNHPDFGFMKKYKIKLNKDGEAYFERTDLTDLEGWGRIFISEEISKGNYSPSPIYGTLAVPILVEVINSYLKSLYKKTAKERIGEGYLFRGTPFNPDVPYASPRGLFRWIARIRDSFEFLNGQQKNNFTFYETRHTINNLIVNRTWIEDQKINEWKQRVAETHSRHSIQEDDENLIQSRGSVNKEHYQDIVPLWMYYKVLDAALNFPFEKNALKEHEKQYNPIVSDLDVYGETVTPSKAKEVETPKVVNEEKPRSLEGQRRLKEIENELVELEKMLSILRVPTKAKKHGISGSERRGKIEETNKQISLLTNEKQKIIQGE